MAVRITLNGSSIEHDAPATIGRLLQEHAIDPSHVVVEINREILSRDMFALRQIADGDVIEILRFVGGG